MTKGQESIYTCRHQSGNANLFSLVLVQLSASPCLTLQFRVYLCHNNGGRTSMATWQQWEGRVINERFPLHRYLGGSEQSVVYLTEIDGSKAAIKLILADAAQAQIQVSRWELASKLSHPHLARILHTGRWRADDERDMHFAVMEYADENLAEILPSRRLTPAEAREMLIPTLDALNYLHERGMVHGNIKPANIMAVGDELKLSSDGIRPMGESEESAETRRRV